MTVRETHVERFENWLLKLRSFLTTERGRASRLAEHLGVSRQNVSRWFVTRSGYKRDVPAWAALTANVWLSRATCPSGERQALSTWGGDKVSRTNRSRTTHRRSFVRPAAKNPWFCGLSELLSAMMSGIGVRDRVRLVRVELSVLSGKRG